MVLAYERNYSYQKDHFNFVFPKVFVEMLIHIDSYR